MTGQHDEIDPTGPGRRLPASVAGFDFASGRFRPVPGRGYCPAPTERASPRYVDSYHRRQP